MNHLYSISPLDYRLFELMRLAVLCSVMFFVAAASGLAQTSVTIKTTKDAFGYEDNNGSHSDDNYGDCDGLVIANEEDYNTHSFIQFNLSSIPAGSTISSAQLVVTHQNWNFWGEGGGNVVFSPRRVTQSWNEGNNCESTASSSELSWDNQPSYTGSYGNQTGNENDSDGTTYTFNVTSLVQGWVDGTFTNYGLALVPNSTTGTGYFAFYSETSNANAPRLEITYDDCGGTPDTDGDGVADVCDSDDDNDGILDTNECEAVTQELTDASVQALPNGGQTSSSFQTTAGGIVTMTSGEKHYDNYLNAQVNDNWPDNAVVFYDDAAPPFSSSISNSDIDWLNTTVTFTFPTAVTNFQIEGLDFDGPGNENIRNLSVSPTSVSSNTFVSNGEYYGNSSNQDITLTFNLSSPVTQISYDVNRPSDGYTIAFTVEIDGCILDTDGDGIIDSKDTDSDNDGCPDAIEGGGSFTSADIDANDMLTGGVDGDGLPNVVSSSGQSVGTSTDANTLDPDCPSFCDVVASVGSQTNVDCFGESTGSASINATGGTTPYQYALNGGAFGSSSTFSNLSAGSYTVTVRDANNCEDDVNFTITQPASAVSGSVASQTNVDCFGESTGSVSINASGGTTPYQYALNGGAFGSSSSFSNLSAGSYTVTVRDANNCEDDVNFTITQPASAVSGSVGSQTNVDCSGESTGSVSINATGGTTPYQYALNGGAFGSSSSFSNLSAGTQTVTVRDANGCEDDVNFTITEPANALSGSVASQTNVDCFGASTGSVTITATGGTPSYQYSLNGGVFGASSTFTGLSAGSYTVTVRDANNCTVPVSFTITQPAGALSLTPTVVQPSCFDFGSITLSVSGGTPPYTYNWADVSGTSNPKDRSGLAPGTYMVTVTDANGCTASSGTITLNAPVDCPAVDICTNDPVVIFSVDPDPKNDSYQWTVPPGAVIVSGQGTPEIEVDWSSVSPGSYQVCVVAENICGSSDPVCQDVNVIDPPNPTASVDPVCEGDVIQFFATGGAEYSWSGPNGFTSSSANPIILNADPNLHDGTYMVTVTNSAGCTATASTMVSVGTPPTLSITNTDNDCGQANGAIDLTVSGGTPSFTFVWSNGATSEDLTGLASGGYFVTVTDANGCSATTGASITSTSGPDIALAPQNIGCPGGMDGAVDLTINSGTSPFTVQWSTGATTEDISGLAAGNYSVTVTDNNGCTASASATLTAPDPIVLDFTKVDVECFGGATGSINLNVSGGTPAYTYNWTKDGSTFSNNQDLSNLEAGLYAVTVTDANNCQETLSITITQPSSGISATPSVLDVDCFGDMNGQVMLSVSGGTQPYTYAWSGPNSFTATTKDIVDRPAGSYSVTVTDANGCSAVAAGITINEPAALSLAGSIASDVSCFGGADGNIDLAVSGGTPGYTYLWNTGETTEDITDLSAGSYSVTVTDANGCTLTQTYVVSQPNQFSFTSTVTNVSCFGGNDGSYEFTLSGGTPPYDYTLLDGSGTMGTINTEGETQVFSGLSSGAFGVQIIDANGCSISENIFITQPILVEVTGAVTDVLCNGDNTGEVLLNVNGGTPPYTYNWSGMGNGSVLRMGLIAGTYSVTVTDALGCEAIESFTINEPAALSPTTMGVNPLCNGDENGSVDLTVSGGTAPYLYSWSSGETTEDIDMVGAGIYTVTVTDDNGCTATATQVVNEPDPLQVVVNQTNVDCFGASTGSIDLTVTGGTTAYTYAWSDSPETTQDRINLAAGAYTVTVTDANNCTETVQVNITQNDVIAISGTVTNTDCFGDSNGSIDLTVSGGDGSYTYAWSDGPSTSQDRTGLSAGDYGVTVTDGLGCTSTATFTIEQPADISLLATPMAPLCFGAATGSIELKVSGGTPGYNYAWSDGSATSQNRTGLAAGTYTVTVTDNNGCTAELTTTINNPAEFTVSIGAIMDVNCLGGADGSATANTMNGSAPFSYVWSNGSTQQTPMDFSAGNYSVTVTDNNGCIAQAGPITINEPTTVIELSATTTPSYFCGVGTGSIDLTVTNGIPPFSYIWTGPGTASGQQDQTGLSPGIYTVEVTDAGGCTAMLDIEVLSTLSLGDPVCEAGGGTYSVTFTETTGAIISTAPGNYTIMGNTITGIPVGTDVQVTATDPDDSNCAITLTVMSPTDCAEQCPDNLISVGTPECAPDFNTYSVSFILAPGTDLTVDPMVGNIGTNEITDIPVGTDITLIADNVACEITELVDVISPDCCPDAPIASVGPVVCVNGSTYEYTFTISPGAIPVSSGGTISGNTVTVPIGVSDTLTVYNRVDCDAVVLIIESPADCNITCEQPDLTIGNSVCVDGDTYKVTFTETTGATITTGPDNYMINGNEITGITLGEDIEITATNPNDPACTVTLIAESPDDCNISCPDELISVSALGECAPDLSTYTVYFTLAPGATLTTDPMVGTIGTNEITGIPSGTDIRLIATNSTCNKTDDIIVIAPVCECPDVSAPNPDGDVAYCAGEPIPAVTVTVTSNQSVNWYDAPTGGNLLSSGTQSYTPSAPGTYYAEAVEISSGCTSATRAAVTVTENPLPIADAGADQSICTGDAATLAASATSGDGNYTFNWDNGLGAGASQNVSPTATTTYTVTVTDGNGCASTDQVTVTVNDNPVADAGAGQSVCDGEASTLTASATGGDGNYTFAWDNGLGAGATQTVNPTASTTYTVTVTDGNGCASTDQVTVTVNDNPVADAGAGQSVCDGDAATLTASATGGDGNYTFAWDNGLGTGATQTVNPTATTTYTVTVTDGNGCASTDQVTVTVNPLPTITVDMAATCAPSLATYTIDITVSGGTVSTSPTINSVTDNGGGSFTLEADVGVDFTVTVTDGNGCEASLPVTSPDCNCPVIAPPVSGGDVEYCAGGVIPSVTATVPSGQAVDWYDMPSGGTPLASGTESFTPAAPGTYYAEAVETNSGCTSTTRTAVTVTENPLPIADAGADQSVCDGDAATLTASATGGDGNYTFAWDTGLGTGATQTVNPTATTTYTVTVTDGNGCASTDQVTVTVNPLPTITVDMVATCAPSLATYTIDITVSGGTVSTSPTINSVTDNGGGSFTLEADVGVDFTVTVTDGNGCEASLPVTSPDCSCPVVDPPISGGDAEYCAGDPIPAVTVTVPSGQTVDWYSVPSGGTPLASSTPSYTPSAPGTYYAEAVEISSGCTSATRTVVMVTEVPAPNINVVPTNPTDCEVSDGRIVITATGATDLQYSIDGGLSFSDNGIFIGLDPGTYDVVVMYGDGCMEDFGTVTLAGPSNPTVTNVSIDNPDDCDSPTGSITVATDTPVLDTEYSIDGGQTWQPSNIFTGLIAGFYEIYVRNSDGTCSTAGPVVRLTEPVDPILLSVTSTDPTGCDGDNGTITAVGDGGVPPYQFQLTGPNGLVLGWTPAATEFTFTGLLAGDYEVTIRNSDGTCEIDPLAIQLDDVSQPTIVGLTTERSECLAGGSATLFVDGGEVLDSYQYSTDGLNWTPGSGSFTFTGLAPGLNTLFVANDDISCPVSIDVVIDNACLELEKSSQLSDTNNDGFIGAGDEISFTFVVTNTGTLPITSVNITDPQLPILAGFAGTLNPGDSYSGASATYTVTAADVAVGEYENQAEASGQDPENMEVTDLSDDPNDPTNNDLEGDGEPDDPTVTIIPNGQPMANDDNVTVCEETSIDVAVVNNDDFGGNGPAMGAITITANASNGTGSVNDNGSPNDPTDDSIDYTPNAGFTGTDMLTYEICDIDGDCDQAVLTIVVEGQLEAGMNGTLEICEGEMVTEADLFAALGGNPDSGGEWTPTPAGAGTYTYTHAATANCDASSAQVVVTENPNPDAGLAVSDDTICEDGAATITISASESGVSYQLRLDADDSNVGTPIAGTGGAISFSVSISSTTVYNVLATNSTTACSAELIDKPTVTTVICNTFAVNDINQTPVNVPVSGNVLTNDFDRQGDMQTVISALADTDGDGVVGENLPLGTSTTLYGTDDNGSTVTAGTLVLSSNGGYDFTPAMDFTGDVPFRYTITDDNPAGFSTDAATVAIEVIGESDPVANEPPVANDDTQVTEQDTDVSGNVLDNDSDPDGDPITVVSALADTDGDGQADDILPVGTPTAVFGTDQAGSVVTAGVLTLNTNGVYSFDPEPPFLGEVPSAYTIGDPDGLMDDATLTILVEGDVGNETYANDDANTGPEGVDQVGNVLDNDSDPENDLQIVVGATDSNGGTITVGTPATLPSGGTLALNANGSYLYEPAAGFVGTEAVRYTVQDNGSPLAATDMATLYLTTLPRPCVEIEAWVYLEGAALDPGGLATYSFPMRTDLNDLRLLPGQVLVDPFLGNKYNPGLAYSDAPWSYFGSEGTLYDSGGDPNQAAAGYPATVVDWVLVSLRETPGATGNPLCQAAALLHDDGRIELTSNFDCCSLDEAQSYYLVVEHRNHLIVMSDAPVPIVGGKLTYDFRNQQSYIDDPFGFGSFAGQKEVSPGVFVMYGGNGDQATSGVSDTDVNSDDRARFELDNSELGEYRIGDFNLSGDTNFADRLIFEQNNGTFTSVPRD